MSRKKLPSHLIIPDPHAHPNYDNSRFKILGQFIADTRPDTIICLGDMADMSSLCSFNSALEAEGQRYDADVSQVCKAQELLQTPANKIRSYRPRWVMCIGNHEDRIERIRNEYPRFDEKFSITDLQYEEKGWEMVPYKESIKIDGIMYSHYFASGVQGRPISGENIGALMCKKLHVSSVQGHSHIFNHAESTQPDGQKLFGLSAGCYTHPDFIEGWNRNFHHMWWRGVVVLGDLDGEGYYDTIYAITLRKLIRDYS